MYGFFPLHHLFSDTNYLELQQTLEVKGSVPQTAGSPDPIPWAGQGVRSDRQKPVCMSVCLFACEFLFGVECLSKEG